MWSLFCSIFIEELLVLGISMSELASGFTDSVSVELSNMLTSLDSSLTVMVLLEMASVLVSDSVILESVSCHADYCGRAESN